MVILITGGAGFIGSNLIHYWLAQNPGDTIVNFDALTYAGNLANLAGVESNRNYHFFQAEDGIRDVERSRGLGDVYKRQPECKAIVSELHQDDRRKSLQDSRRRNFQMERRSWRKIVHTMVQIATCG